MFDLDSVYKALLFAVRAHDGQKMKFPSDVDYTGHIFGVALTAINFIANEDVDKSLVIKVALLHDVLEDTNVGYAELEENFGEEVASGVLALTKNDEVPKEKQMEDSLNRILHLNKREVAIVKLADRCFNTRCNVESWNRQKQLEYLAEAEMICKKLGAFCPKLRDKILENVEKNRA